MPQLNPHPWLYSLLVTWAVLLMLLLPSTLKSKHPKHPNLPPTPSLKKEAKKETWKWH